MSGEIREIKVAITTRPLEQTGLESDAVVELVRLILEHALQAAWPSTLSLLLRTEPDVI